MVVEYDFSLTFGIFVGPTLRERVLKYHFLQFMFLMNKLIHRVYRIYSLKGMAEQKNWSTRRDKTYR